MVIVRVEVFHYTVGVATRSTGSNEMALVDSTNKIGEQTSYVRLLLFKALNWL